MDYQDCENAEKNNIICSGITELTQLNNFGKLFTDYHKINTHCFFAIKKSPPIKSVTPKHFAWFLHCQLKRG
ncbi:MULTISPECIES: hypothetical protein [unclassified Bacillus (in: firmicutes)]|uniref:hypothetical protein n=1 Tax=unclassified Bacillus (in: firmicutes) TaxID=185979 RepID=UPI0027E14B89|nr:hypothetical protein [Bacillus sp. ISL-40]